LPSLHTNPATALFINHSNNKRAPLSTRPRVLCSSGTTRPLHGCTCQKDMTVIKAKCLDG